MEKINFTEFAKSIREEGETWRSALQRASVIYKSQKETTPKSESETKSKLSNWQKAKLTRR